MRYDHSLEGNPKCSECEHQLIKDELFMCYKNPLIPTEYLIVCLTCHFWYVEEGS